MTQAKTEKPSATEEVRRLPRSAFLMANMNNQINIVKSSKVVIYVPNKKDPFWKLRWGKGGIRKRKSVASLFNAIEHRYLRSQLNEKISIVITYGKDAANVYVNESLASTDVHYLLYTTLCFLEDYLPRIFIIKKLQKYRSTITNI